MTQKPYDNKADVYSFALMMWELVTNELPFKDLDQMGLLMKVGLQGERPNLPAPDSRCSSELINLIKMCWDQDPTKRPQFEEVTKTFAMLEKQEERRPITEELISKDIEIDHSKLQLEATALGEGSFGIVYKAKYFGADVAVKKIKCASQFTSNMIEEFKSEISIMHKLRHPNVVLFMGAVSKLENFCIVTQYCNNGDLYAVLHKNRTQHSLSQILNIGKGIAVGMAYLHGNKIVHRDLKSLNVLMDEHNAPKIADFGLSRVKTTSMSMSKAVGTPLWMVNKLDLNNCNIIFRLLK